MFYFQPVHKLQSSAVPNIQLQLVPKLLAPLVSIWVPHAYVVSFKLETDENILISKARTALNKYKHKVRVINIIDVYILRSFHYVVVGC